jgi:subtilisin family serine protease
MKRLTLFLLGGCLLAGLSACSVDKDEAMQSTQIKPQSAEGSIIPNQYIIQLKPSVVASARERLDWATISDRDSKIAQMNVLNVQVEKELDQWLAQFDLADDAVIQKYTAAMVGAALKLTDRQYNLISKNAAVGSLEFDRYEEIPPFKIESVGNANGRVMAQTTPCGITNAGGAGTANGAWIWIVDSGIDLDHPDLNVQTNTTYAVSFAGGTADDCNGHGTHVAGIAAARNNAIGVIGMAPGALVVPVRVFPCSGPSATSTIVSGINHVATYDLAGDVMNLSLGGYYGTSGCSTGSSYLTSVTTVANGGTHVAIASGNNNSVAAYYQPGCISGTRIYTVTNMRCDKSYYNDVTFGGNYGRPPVDWIATGTNVYSTYLSGGYATLTGTSMATPHVAGILHLRNAAPLSSGNVTYGGVTYPIAVR